jgi:hypothetical protein
VSTSTGFNGAPAKSGGYLVFGSSEQGAHGADYEFRDQHDHDD